MLDTNEPFNLVFTLILSIILPGFVGLLGGILGGYFQSLMRKREKKFELLYDFRKGVYSTLYKITFINDSLGQSRYDWQIDCVKKGEETFHKEFKQWLDLLKEFNETTSWSIDKTVRNKLEKLLEISGKVDGLFWSAQYEAIDINNKEVDDLFFRIEQHSKEVRTAIQKDMELK